MYFELNLKRPLTQIKRIKGLITADFLKSLINPH